MKILIYGEGEARDYGVVAPFKPALLELGNEVDVFDWPAWLYCANNRSIINRVLDRVLFHEVAYRINKDFLLAINRKKYDLLIVIRGNHLFPSSIDEAKKKGIKTVNWNPDDFFNKLNSSRYIRNSFNKYDCIFTSRGHLKEQYLKMGAQRVEMLHWYYRPDIQHPLILSEADRAKYGSDIVFIGSWSKRRVDILSVLPPLRLRVWGSGWHKAGSIFRKRVDCRGPIFAGEMTKAICASKININILTAENRDTTNIRNFEIPACGGFQLSERSDEILRLFEEGREIACFGDSAELASKCAFYLSDDKARVEIAENGYKKLILGKNTPLDRARQILDTVFS